MTNIYVEGFLSSVFLWVFLTLSVLTAILILRALDALAGLILHRLTRRSRETHEAIQAALERIAVIERQMK